MSQMIFIGGPANGRVMEVPDGNRYWIVPSFADDGAPFDALPTARQTTYRVQKLAVKVDHFVATRECMVTSDVTAERAIGELKSILFEAWMKGQALT